MVCAMKYALCSGQPPVRANTATVEFGCAQQSRKPALHRQLPPLARFRTRSERERELVAINLFTINALGPSPALASMSKTMIQFLGDSAIRPFIGCCISAIPVKVAADWDNGEVGNLQLDYVEHCGRSNRGEYIHTLSAADIASGWWGRSDLLTQPTGHSGRPGGDPETSAVPDS